MNKKRLQIGLLIWANAVLVGSYFMCIPFLSIYLSEQVTTNYTLIGVVVGVAPLVTIFGGILFGYASDIFSKTNIVYTAFILRITCFLGFAFSSQVHWLIVFSLCNGLSMAMSGPAMRSLISEIVPSKIRRKVFKKRYLAQNVGIAIGPALGAYFATTSVTNLFLICAIMVAILSIVMFYIFSGFKQDRRRNPSSFLDSLPIVTKNTPFILYMLGGTIVSVAYSQLDATIPLYINFNFNFNESARLVAYFITLNAILCIVFQLILDKISSLIGLGESLESLIGILFIVMAFIFLALVPLTFQTLTIFVILYTIGEILEMSNFNILIDRFASPDNKGLYFGLSNFRNFGLFIGPILGGYILNYIGGTALFVSMAIFSLIGSFVINSSLSNVTPKSEIISK